MEMSETVSNRHLLKKFLKLSALTMFDYFLLLVNTSAPGECIEMLHNRHPFYREEVESDLSGGSRGAAARWLPRSETATAVFPDNW